MTAGSLSGAVLPHAPSSPPARPRSYKAREDAERQRFLAYWRDEVKRRPPAERERFLESNEGRVALGAKTCRQLLREIHSQREGMRSWVPGGAWLDAWDREAIAFPPRDEHGRTGMVMSSARTPWDLDDRANPLAPDALKLTRAQRRWTPPHAVEVEDYLDSMGFVEACRYEHPASPSAVAIIRIGELAGKELG